MIIDITAAPRETQGTLRLGGRRFACALGRAGIVRTKCEGDGGTPQGTWPLREMFYRADRLSPPETGLPLRPLHPSNGWCDAVADPAYNRPVRLPYPASAENLWRTDPLYDVIIVLGYNDNPVVPGAGSAIFFHIAQPQAGALRPTEGCVAVSLDDMREILPDCTPKTLMRIG